MTRRFVRANPMKTEVVLVTPLLAKKWLERNTDNRDIRPSVVTGLAESITRGEWVLSHQGIAFAKSGRLLDGQHRLLAIVEANRSVQLVVTRDVDDGAFTVMDIGTKRSVSDVLNTSKSLAATARFFAVLEGVATRSGITPQYLVPFISAIEPFHSDLVAFCPTLKKTWSSAAVQAAAVMRMMDGEDADYVKIIYHALVHLEFDSMPPVAQSLFRQFDSGTARSNPTDMFARCLKVFSRASADMRKIQINQNDSALAYARGVIAHYVHGQKKPPTSGGKRLVKAQRNYTAR